MRIVFLNPTAQLGGTERSLRDFGETVMAASRCLSRGSRKG